jgi:hypothetical protein
MGDIRDIGAPDEVNFEDCGDLARSLDILSHLAVDLELAGVAGELRSAKIIYLAVTSRLFPWPLSVARKGPSSAGKSFTVERTLRFFPNEAYLARTAMSERGLVYTDEDLQHRMLVLYEADAVATGRGAYLLGTLLSEGMLRYEVVERTREGYKTRLIEREGPTGLIMTTTQTGLDPELETRLLSLTVTDTAAQTKAVMQALARSRSSSGAVPVDYARWHDFQQWLSAGERRVVVPFAEKVAELVLAICRPAATRFRRIAHADLRPCPPSSSVAKPGRVRRHHRHDHRLCGSPRAGGRRVCRRHRGDGAHDGAGDCGRSCGAEEERGVARRTRRETRAGQERH